MAYMMVHGFCIACNSPINYNPNHVPSLPVNGKREAICRSCHAEWNRIHRTSKGMEPLPLHPQAYEAEEVA